MKSLYLWVDLLVILIPLVGSFENRVRYYRRWKPLFGSILLVLVPFILWDILFTALGIWHFNADYSGYITLLGLPLGEWLFFICIPYACVYIYEWVCFFMEKSPKPLQQDSLLYWFHGVLGLACLLMALIMHEKAYTSIVLGLSGVLLLLINVVRPAYMIRFWVAYLFTLIPFFIVNGFLTAKPIVLYDNQENLGLRLYTIPVEDLFYTFLMLMPIIMIYERWLKRDS